MNWINLVSGVLLAGIVSAAAYRARALDRSGALAAAGLGTVVFGIGGLPATVVLLGFFVTSSGLSRLFRRRKQRLDEKFSKGSRRDAGQVLANGGTAGVCILIWAAFPESAAPWLAFCGSLAAANADTWATELGVLNRTNPRLITTGQAVEPGTSGAISLVGMLAAGGGALLIAILGILAPALAFAGPASFTFPASNSPAQWAALLVAVLAAGTAGSLVDSLLGATLQAIYTCPACRKETERHPLHTCGTPTRLLRGLSWLDNDWVNTACTLTGALIGGLAGIFCGFVWLG